MSRLRRTMLYVPGNNPGMIADVHIYGADAVMFDLEDSISVYEKDAARNLVAEALRALDFGSAERVVRINGLDTPHGERDIDAMVGAGADVIRLPKTECRQDVTQVEDLILAAEKRWGRQPGSTRMMAAIEGPLGVLNAREIAFASPRLVGIALGAEDYVTALKTSRSPEGTELLLARSQILTAARAAGIAALDTVFSDVEDEAGFSAEVALIKGLGFDGKSVINPRQIDVVHRLFSPTEKEITHARAVVRANSEALEKGLGVISLNGKMIDKPIVDRAVRVLELAGLTAEGGIQ